MRLIIAGSRDLDNENLVHDIIDALDRGYLFSEVISGGAVGPDKYGETWAKLEGLPVKYFIADWDAYGKRAGPIRNAEMAKYADALLAFWDGESKGTKNMIDQARKNNLKVWIFQYSHPQGADRL